MSENSRHCPDCGGSNGFHYNDCIYDGTGSNSGYSSGSGNGISTFGAIMCIIVSFVGVAFLFMIFDVDVESVPTFVIVVLLIIMVSVIAGVVSAFKNR